MESVDKLRELLKSAGSGNKNLYDHLIKVFTHIIYLNPSNPLECFEELSQNLKGKKLQFIQQQSRQWLKENWTDISQWIERTRELLDKPKEENDDGEMVEAPQDPIAYAPDLLWERYLYRDAGIDFGDGEYFQLQQSIKRLLRQTPIQNLRFWGKIYGIKSDYYIVEGNYEGEDQDNEEELPPEFEKKGEGVNTLTYWATSSPLEPWVQLPDVSPRQIGVARQLRKLFTGDLEADIVSNPYFPGKEKHYLRAQIARIYHGTTLIPIGQYREVEEEPQQIEQVDEPIIHGQKDYQKLQTWCHYTPSILKENRITHADVEVPEDQDLDPEELKLLKIKSDPYEKRLKSITSDRTPLKYGVIYPDSPQYDDNTAWIVRITGDNQSFHPYPPANKEQLYQTTIIKSLWWPGAHIISYRGNYLHIYVGSGLKTQDQQYYPIDVPKILTEPDDRVGQPEPTPLEEPVNQEEEEEED